MLPGFQITLCLHTYIVTLITFISRVIMALIRAIVIIYTLLYVNSVIYNNFIINILQHKLMIDNVKAQYD